MHTVDVTIRDIQRVYCITITMCPVNGRRQDMFTRYDLMNTSHMNTASTKALLRGDVHRSEDAHRKVIIDSAYLATQIK